ncbi:MAG: cytochrome c maturation protein CcmE [Xanthomonadales bacterium]|nr:cytochrome c maturation protein CcmE [Xanthomonadales bacterium]MCB1635523.1 cytochrome c maturation protein CcmE [Xanthomonadales bacterium]
MHPLRRQRMIAIVALLLGLGVASTFVLLALNENLDVFYSPTDIADGKVEVGRRFKLGGVVLEDSTRRDPQSLLVNFVVTDRFREVPVRYQGILPDLFKEGQSVIATGSIENGIFTATQVLAKHDETYMPKEVAEAIDKAKHRTASEATSNGGSAP